MLMFTQFIYVVIIDLTLPILLINVTSFKSSITNVIIIKTKWLLANKTYLLGKNIYLALTQDL